MNLKSLSKKITIVDSNSSIDASIRLLSDNSKKVSYPGFCAVINQKNHLVGVITDGDIRRAYVKGVNFNNAVSEIMTTSPVTINANQLKHNLKSLVDFKIAQSNHISKSVRLVPVIDEQNIPIDIIDFLNSDTFDANKKNVAVFGLGYVGITLAASLANIGHKVSGIDTNEEVIALLNNGKTHVHEPGLVEMIRHNIKAKNLNIDSNLSLDNQIYIVAVGTPLDRNNKPNLSFLNEVLSTIVKRLKPGDHVMLRSTVPVGVTRKFVVPFLENETKLSAGIDFFVSFAPERTIEGDAMRELRSLPQIIGGFSEKCCDHGIKF